MKKSTTFYSGEYGQFGFVGTKDVFGWTCTSEKLCQDSEGNFFMRLHWRK